jgi:TetR/AcrR family transcriptional regulator
MPADASETRAAILDAAEEVFSAKGFAAASMSEIASRSGVTKSLLHHHFGSKEGLWHAAKERRFQSFWAAQSALLEVLPADAELLERSVSAYFAFLQENPSFVRLMSWHFLEHDELTGADTVGPAQMAAAVEKVRAGQVAGHIRDDVDPSHLILLYFSLVVHWHQGKSVYLSWLGSPVSDESYLRDLLRVFMRGISPAG